MIAVVGITGYVMRDRIISKILSMAELRLAENGLYIGHDSHALSWSRGVVLTGLHLYADEERRTQVAEFDNVGIRIPLLEVFSDDASVVISSEHGFLKVETSAGDLNLDDLDFKLKAARESLDFDHFEAKFGGLQVGLVGGLKWVKGEGESEVVIPDLAPLVKTTSWLEFSGGSARLDVTLVPPEAPGDSLGVSGKLSGEGFHWRDLEVDRAKVSVEMVEGGLKISALDLTTCGGQVTGALNIDFQSEKLELEKVESSADPFQLVDGILGRKLLGSFRSLGGTSVSGEGVVFDLRKFSQSRGTFLVNSSRGIVIPFDRADFPLVDFSGTVRFESGDLNVDAQSFSLWAGKCSGVYRMPLAGKFSYLLKVDVAGLDLSQAGQAFALEKEARGSLNAGFDGGGGVGIQSPYGNSWVKVSDGRFYSMPLIGSLRSFLAGKSEHFGMDEAGDLSATMSLKKGVIRSPDLRVESTATLVHLDGSADLVRRHIDVRARANLNGVVGVATELVSRVFEVHGTGPFGDVKWKMTAMPSVLSDAAATTKDVVEGTTERVGDTVKDIGEGMGEAAGALFEKRPSFLKPRKKEKE